MVKSFGPDFWLGYSIWKGCAKPGARSVIWISSGWIGLAVMLVMPSVADVDFPAVHDCGTFHVYSISHLPPSQQWCWDAFWPAASIVSSFEFGFEPTTDFVSV